MKERKTRASREAEEEEEENAMEGPPASTYPHGEITSLTSAEISDAPPKSAGILMSKTFRKLLARG